MAGEDAGTDSIHPMEEKRTMGTMDETANTQELEAQTAPRIEFHTASLAAEPEYVPTGIPGWYPRRSSGGGGGGYWSKKARAARAKKTCQDCKRCHWHGPDGSCGNPNRRAGRGR